MFVNIYFKVLDFRFRESWNFKRIYDRFHYRIVHLEAPFNLSVTLSRQLVVGNGVRGNKGKEFISLLTSEKAQVEAVSNSGHHIIGLCSSLLLWTKVQRMLSELLFKNIIGHVPYDFLLVYLPLPLNFLYVLNLLINSLMDFLVYFSFSIKYLIGKNFIKDLMLFNSNFPLASY